MSAEPTQTSFLRDAGTFNTLCAYWAERHGDYIKCLREHALRILDRNRSKEFPNGRVTIDDLRDEMSALHLPMPSDIGADDRMFGSVLRGCDELKIVGVEQTRRSEWAKRVGMTRSMVSVYSRKEKPSRCNATA